MIEDKPLFDRFFKERRYENAHYNFTNLFMWRKAYNIQWTVQGAFLCVKAQWQGEGEGAGEHFFLPPFGPEEGLADIIEQLLEHARENNFPFRLQGVEKYRVDELEKIKPDYFECTADRDEFDYIYLTKDLIELKGRKFHSKKNHVNGFRKTYRDYKYVPLTAEMTEECIAFMVEWCTERGCIKGDSIDCERKAITEAMNHFTVLDFKGGAIYIDGKMAAFTYGEVGNDDTVVIHVEKGHAAYKGIYGVINQEFCAHEWPHMTYVNREEDMGIEGLRKAKESYNPVKMIEKYFVTIKA